MMIQKTNLTFSQALEALKNGERIRVPEWKGYWFLEGGIIKVMTHDGKVLDTPWLTQPNILREDWQVVD